MPDEPSAYYLVFDAISSADTHWALRGTFEAGRTGAFRLRCCGAGWYRVWVDGEFALEGPVRFDAAQPEWQELALERAPGAHVIAVHWHDMRVTTRLQQGDLPAFLGVDVSAGDRSVPVAWRGRRLDGYQRTGRQLGCVLGWVEWEDTRNDPAGWAAPDFDDSAWQALEAGARPAGIGAPVAPSIGPMGYFARTLTPATGDKLVNMSMVDHDPPMNFAARELDPAATDLPANGVWWRFDLGRARLGRPRITLDAPEGALVQIAQNESLIHGRVYPYLSGGGGDDSCPLDTWVARGGRQTFEPHHPKGARYLEVHALADPDAVAWVDGTFVERCYYPEEAEGDFRCDDARLNRIWQVGVDTLRACAEDAITDNPTRERGQWLGDATGPGMEIVACTQRDHRPLTRGLRQAAQCAADNGMLPAIFPGTREYLPSFAIQWVAAIPMYFRRSGDRSVLEDLYPAARRIVAAFEPHRVEGGVKRMPGYWNFIDWGYAGASTVFRHGGADEERLDPALSLFFLRALRALGDWAELLGESPEAARERAASLEREMRASWLNEYTRELGFHASALALREDLLDASESAEAVDAVKRHIRDCFPWNPDAPRLENVRVESERLITPFFLHFALPVLVERGEASFVHETMRRCWGWMLDRGATTWYEVFDPRWSQCHQWSGCPTWILSHYALGLAPRFDRAPRHYDFVLRPGALDWAEGALPGGDGTRVRIAWSRETSGVIRWNVESEAPIALRLPDGTVRRAEGGLMLNLDATAPEAVRDTEVSRSSR